VHARGPSQALISRPPPPGPPTRAPAARRLLRRTLAGTLERRRRCSSPPLPLHHREAVPELRKEARSSQVPLVVVPVHRFAEEGSPEFAAAPSRTAA
jgi:hypothetical protein